MLKFLFERWKQGHRTLPFPPTKDDGAPRLPDRFRGRPAVDPTRCTDGCSACVESCPTDALQREGGKLRLDLGRCLFCPECVESCPSGAMAHTRDYRLAASRREDLVLHGSEALTTARALGDELRRLLGRSLKLRVVSAGGCNGCEADVNVLGTVVFDLGRFGIQYVASPRHADGLLITGPVTENMRLALQKTWEATPSPKIVIAVGACAISGGPFQGHPESCDGAASVVPVDLYVPGCPPHPLTILDGLLRLIGRIRDDDTAQRHPETDREAMRYHLDRAEEAARLFGVAGKPSDPSP